MPEQGKRKTALILKIRGFLITRTGACVVMRRTWPQGYVRAASVGQLSDVYVINRLTRHLSVLDVIWIG